MSPSLDLDLLLKLRLVVARHGEMDGARWWNTQGVLGRKGEQLMSRGFPKGHRFAQARLAFEVARSRSEERFPTVANCITLWNLTAEAEEAFDGHWSTWLDNSESWIEFFECLHEVGDDLLTTLRQSELLEDRHEELVSKMKRSSEGRSVPLPPIQRLDNDTITLLAAGFACSDPGKPAVPYAQVEV